nr:substrate-binding domain-containing protein [Clostridium sp. OM04-12AA]
MAECSQKTWPGSGYHSHCQRDLPVRKRVSGGKAPSGVPSTALLCFNDEMAFGAREAIVEEGLKVPDDVSLIGFDNWDMSGYSSMKLTTVERSMSEIAKEGTRVLLRRIEDGVEDNRRIVLENRLIVRNTVRRLV